MYRKFIYLMLCVMVVLASSCVSQPPQPTSSPLESPLPAVSAPANSPIPTPVGAVKFQIDRPVKIGATVVTGQGPAGVPISIVNVTDMGSELGVGVIGADSRFSITVQPLLGSTRIGLGLGDLGGTNLNAEDFNADAYKGSEALVVPMVGYFQDTALVQP